MTRDTIEVRHNAAAHRFEAAVEGWLCVAAYTRAGDVLRIHHTEVPPAVGNRGIAAQIVRAVFAYADAHGLKVEPRCSYVRNYMRRHPETLRLLPADSPLRH